MTIQIFACGPFATNCYIVTCPQTKQCAVIDAPPESFALASDYIEKNRLDPRMILLTHSHWDHIADVMKFKQRYKIPVFVHPEDAENLKNPGADRLPCWVEITPVVPDGDLNDGREVHIGDLIFKVIHTPGHSPGGVSLFNKEKKILFSGDTLFQGTIGNISFPTSRPSQMWDSLKKLAKLPPETKVYPGHGPTTTIGAESWLAEAEEIFGH